MALKNTDIRPGQDEDKFYNMYKTELRNENDNLNQRVIWNIFAQAGLFGAYAAVLNAPKDGKSLLFSLQQDWLVWILPLMSFTIAAMTLPVIYSSILYMRNLRATFRERMGASPEGLPPVMGGPESNVLAKMADYAPLVLPMSIVATWAIIFAGQIYHAWLM